jgi:hypothetical protein
MAELQCDHLTVPVDTRPLCHSKQVQPILDVLRRTGGLTAKPFSRLRVNRIEQDLSHLPALSLREDVVNIEQQWISRMKDINQFTGGVDQQCALMRLRPGEPH